MSSAPWVEKYRPTKLDDIVHHKDIISVLKQTLVTNEFPNLLLYGPPGTGKTSSIMALARAMFGPKFGSHLLHLNASDERGIEVVRERIKRFSQSVSTMKLVILDEADSMTSAAQSCLRRTMEIYSSNTRFCIICNYISRIIEPIASRCCKLRFQPIAAPSILERLEHICKNENVVYSDKMVLEHLVEVCEGDLRQAITTLQSAHRLAGQNISLDLDLIHEVSGFIPRRHINRFMAICKSKSLERMEEYIHDLIQEGYTASQFLSQTHEMLMENSNLDDSKLAKIIPAFALAEHRFCDGSDEFIQLLYVASVVMENYN